MRADQEMHYGLALYDQQLTENRKTLRLQYCKLDTATMVVVWLHWEGHERAADRVQEEMKQPSPEFAQQIAKPPLGFSYCYSSSLVQSVTKLLRGPTFRHKYNPARFGHFRLVHTTFLAAATN